MVLNLVIYIAFFVVIWLGSGFIVSGLEDLSHKLKISAFATSFFILGLLTSIPEMSVGINAIIDGTPQIFVGNLIGASLVLFVVAIPLLAIFGNGIKLSSRLDKNNLLIALMVVILPAVFAVDGKLVGMEGVILIASYGVLFYHIEKKKDWGEVEKDIKHTSKTHIAEDVTKIITGAVCIFTASKVIVDKTIYFGEFFQISPYVISLIVLSLGTNLPELSLAIRSIILKKKEVALGDYVGSAAANTIIFGVLTILSRNAIVIDNHSAMTLIMMCIGFGLFYLFSKSKNDISVKEGLLLFLVYVTFIFIEYAGNQM